VMRTGITCSIPVVAGAIPAATAATTATAKVTQTARAGTLRQ
jgi:hypothetical protein